MSGSAVYDFGDMVRTATSPAAEDEVDVSKVTMQIHMFEALVKYLASANSFLTDAYVPALLKIVNNECGTRFLCDYLYFKTHRDGYNSLHSHKLLS